MKFDWIKQAFSDSGIPSSSRLLSAICTFVVIGWGTYYLLKTHLLPDGVTMGGLAAFGTSHYMANRVTGVFKKDDPAIKKGDPVIKKDDPPGNKLDETET